MHVRAYRSSSFFSRANGIFRQPRATETGRITTLRRPKEMDLNVRLKLCLHPCELRFIFHTDNGSSKQQAPKPPKHSQPLVGGRLIVSTYSYPIQFNDSNRSFSGLLPAGVSVNLFFVTRAEGIGTRHSPTPPRPPHPGNVQQVHVPTGDPIRAFQISSCELKSP